MVILVLFLALYKAKLETLAQTLGRIRGYETWSTQVNAGTCRAIYMIQGPKMKSS